jgi:hypothetical protein
LLPDARVTIIDGNRENLEQARALLNVGRVTCVYHRYCAGDAMPFDLIVFPLSFDGDRQLLYTRPPAPAVIVHDWIWRKRGTSRIVSLALLKRVNMVRR